MQKMITFNKYLTRKSTKRALLSYLTEPAAEELKNKPTTQFSNNGAARTWPKVLNMLGYQVDVIDWDNTSSKIDKTYDLIVMHGGKNPKKLAGALKPSGKLIYYSTGSYWKYHNVQEALRFKNFEKRNKLKLKQDRHIDDDEEYINRKADAIISLGNNDTAATYSGFKNVYSLEGAGYEPGVVIRREFESARKHFLFLSGPGNIHKGLDLAIEAFRLLPDCHLHILGVLNDDFRSFYAEDLYNSHNIHTYGYVPQRSTLYYAVIRQCGYSMLLSCSEGSPGSVIESIQQGMVPLVTKESHIDLPPEGILITNLGIGSLAASIANAASVEPRVIADYSAKMVVFGRKQYSVEHFEKRLSQIIKQVMEQEYE